ncbi:MAG: acyltransferase [Reyranella sp.]|nr:acyltransferase [Reyranella sp.]
MRGIASILVACFHFGASATAALPEALTTFAWLGVDVFFVISGFVIPLSLYAREYQAKDFSAFLLRRLVRIEPPYLASILLTIFLWHLSASFTQSGGSEPSYSLAQIGFHLFYLVPLTDYAWLGPNYWSLAYEFVFYIVVGLTFPILMPRGSTATFATIAAVAAFYFYLQRQLSWDPLITVRVVEFGIGVLLMRLVVDRGRRSTIANSLYLIACLAFVFHEHSVIGAVVLASVAAIFLLKDAKLGPWAYFIGGFSYSLYLTHTLIGGRIVNIGKRFGSGDVYETILIGIALAGSIAFALIFAHFFEGPAKRAAQRIG